MEIPKEKDLNFRNILILSVGFMMLMAAFLTMGGIEQTVLQSVQVEDPAFSGDGYISLAIIYAAFSISNFIAPTVVSCLGVRTSMVLGTIIYGMFIAGFLYPSAWLLYGTSAMLGFAAANVWVANGIYFTRCSTKETIGKNMGVYWVIVSSGMLFGNAFVFWQFRGRNHIDSETRFIVTFVLTGISACATIILVFLGAPGANNKKAIDVTKDTKSGNKILNAFTEPFQLLKNKHMLLLIPSSMYNGYEIAFFSGIYPTAVGFTDGFGADARKLVGVAGIIIGIGTLLGGLIFGVFGEKVVNSKRSPVVVTGCAAHVIAIILMYINLPNSASLGPTKDLSWMDPPSVNIAMICAFLLGLGDGCVLPQICAAIGVIWPENPSAALAIYRFFQAATCAAGFFVGTLTGLYNQLIAFLVIVLIGTASFCVNEKLIEQEDQNAKIVPVMQVAVITKKMSIECISYNKEKNCHLRL